MLKVECCSGNGEWIASRAKEDPQARWIAIEMRQDRATKIWRRIERESLDNLFLMCGLAQDLIPNSFEDHSIDELHINFPDPWPKKRHAKHRLMQPSFIIELHKKLKPGALFTLITDDLTYMENASILFENGWKPHFPAPFFLEWNRDAYGYSFFAQLWQQKGKVIYKLVMERC